MSSLYLQNIYKKYPSGVVAVTDFTLDIKDKEFIVFVGPSGCGKSTTLRMIAGLEDISEGELFIDEKYMNNVQPKDRDIAMVFQNYALYPHLTVYENMAFGLRLRHIPKAEIDERVHEAARILGLEQYLKRKPKALSGGQKQRVALGRAIVREPKVFLLDEPLSNLDAKLRASMRTEITKLHQRLGTTFIYVTHDQVEAMTMGTRIVVMKDGLIQQVDTPIHLFDYPANLFVAGFIGTPQMNFADAVLVGENNKVYVEFENRRVELTQKMIDRIINIDDYVNTGRPVVFGVRPEDLHDDEETIAKFKNQLIDVKVDQIERLGAETLLYCKYELEGSDDVIGEGAKKPLIAKVDGRSTTMQGEIVKLALDIDHCHLFDKETELSILEGEGTKAYVPEYHNAKLAEQAVLEAEAAKIAAEKEAKKANKKAKKEEVEEVIEEVEVTEESEEA